MTIRPLAALAALTATAAVVLTACGTTSDADGGTEEAAIPLTLGLTYVPDVQFAPVYVAQEVGYFAEAGFDVTLRHHGANEGLFSALEQGTEDAVVASGDEVLAQRASGGDLEMVAQIYQTSPVALLVPLGSPAATGGIAALDGAIGVPGEFGSTWLGLLMLLADEGLELSDVQVQNIGYTQATALVSGQVAGVMGFSNGDGVRIAESGMALMTFPVPDLVSVGLAVPESSVLTEDQLLALREAVMKGAADVIADPEAAVTAAAEYIPGMTAQAKEDALAVVRATVPLLGTTGQTDPAAWDAMAQAMLAAGMIEAIPSGGYLTPAQ